MTPYPTGSAISSGDMLVGLKDAPRSDPASSSEPKRRRPSRWARILLLLFFRRFCFRLLFQLLLLRFGPKCCDLNESGSVEFVSGALNEKSASSLL